MLVFREGRRTHSGPALLLPLLECLRRLSGPGANSQPDLLLQTLLRAGELECGLADLNSPHCSAMAAATDVLAELLLGGKSRGLSSLADALDHIEPPARITVSTPEGFAYYALHPQQYADLAYGVPMASPNAAVVGIRSIGTTLSAVVAAALARRGIKAERITARPGGHPFDRKTEFSPADLRWVAAQRARHAEFLVVDEGPGLSGSSFLSVGDALLQAGVSRNSIAFLSGARPNPDHLCAPNASQRWRDFRCYAVLPRSSPIPESAIDLSGGLWRQHVLEALCDWPGSWITMERAKFLSPDHRRIFKFEGLGHYGVNVAERARMLADAGFGPACENFGGGYLAYVKESGQPATRMDLCQPMLDRMAEYCAFRACEFRVRDSNGEDLPAMAAWNLHEEFGVPNQPQSADLQIKIPVIADGRMPPHEWLLTAGGILKTDGVSHGDDHFFPGPTDVAWDLAGAVVEWEMGEDASSYLLQRYAALCGDQAQQRLPAWVQAYTAFRMGYCKMAAECMRGSEEEERLLREYRRYRARAQAALAQPVAA